MPTHGTLCREGPAVNVVYPEIFLSKVLDIHTSRAFLCGWQEGTALFRSVIGFQRLLQKHIHLDGRSFVDGGGVEGELITHSSRDFKGCCFYTVFSMCSNDMPHAQ